MNAKSYTSVTNILILSIDSACESFQRVNTGTKEAAKNSEKN